VTGDRAVRAGRQLVETSRWFGAGFVPVRAASPGEAAQATGAGGSPGEPDPGEDQAARLDALRKRHARECPYCTNAKGVTNIVFGEGNPDARLMFIGEAPGAEEDRTGRPFVGRAGKLLDSMINAMGLRREDVYIANVLKSRPPDNATPTSEEAEQCGPYLFEQVAIIEPEVIVTLGRPAAQLLLETRESMGRMRGRWHEFEGVPVMPTFHPAYLLRQYTVENRKKVWSDLRQVVERLGLPGQGAVRSK